MFRRTAAVTAVALAVAGAIVAAAPSPRVARAAQVTGRPVVTVYSHDLGFVREWRTLTLGAAFDTVRIADVPERIDVASVRLTPQAGRVGRLAYRYDVQSGDGLFETAKGSGVRVTLRGDRVVEGTLVSSDGTWLVVRENDGTLHTLQRTSVDDVRFAMPPKRLFTRPMLEAVIEGARRGDMPAELSYLTGGLSWSAEHTLVRTSEESGTWQSSVTIDNQTGRDWTDVVLKLVAGDPQRAQSAPPPMPYMRAVTMQANVGDAAAEKQQMSEEAFADYHLYTIDAPATLRNRETQSLVMYETRPVKLTPRYLFRGWDGRGVRTQLELVNEKDRGLGVALPGGRVRVFSPDAAADLQFTGETTIGHTADGEKVTLDIGRAFDLVGERKETANRRISDREREVAVEVTLRNRKSVPATIVVEEMVPGDHEIIAKSRAFTEKDANTIQFSVLVAAGKTETITYTVRNRY